MNDETVVQQETKEEVKEMSAIERIIGIFFSPRKTFEYLREKPKWLVPFIIICLVAVVSNFLARDFAVREQIERIQLSDRLSDEQKDQYIERIQESSKGGKALIGVVAAPVFILAVLVIVSAIFLFCGNMLFGGKATFRQLLGMYAHAGLISIPGAIVKVPIMVARQSTKVQTSLAVLMPSDAEKSFLYKLLGKFDIFTIWQVILLIIGISVVYRFAKGKAATLVLILWAVWIVLSLALGSVFEGFGFA